MVNSLTCCRVQTSPILPRHKGERHLLQCVTPQYPLQHHFYEVMIISISKMRTTTVSPCSSSAATSPSSIFSREVSGSSHKVKFSPIPYLFLQLDGRDGAVSCLMTLPLLLLLLLVLSRSFFLAVLGVLVGEGGGDDAANFISGSSIIQSSVCNAEANCFKYGCSSKWTHNALAAAASSVAFAR